MSAREDRCEALKRIRTVVYDHFVSARTKLLTSDLALIDGLVKEADRLVKETEKDMLFWARTNMDVRKMRKALGWTMGDAARRFGCSVSKISSLETGGDPEEPWTSDEIRTYTDLLDT